LIFCANSTTGIYGILMTEVNFTVFEASWEKHQHEIRFIRTQVFVHEQRVPEELEWDGLDDTAIHVLAFTSDQIPAGTARLLISGQIGRMAVLKQYRNMGIGTAMLIKLIQIAASHNINPLFLNAQLHAIRFYEKHGFIPDGGIFDDAGIPHRKMIHNSL